MSPSAGYNAPDFTHDPDRGYNRYSFYRRPPDLEGHAIIHVRAHMRGKAHIREHWFYSRLDKNGRQLRGRDAGEKMTEMGLKLTSAPPEILTVKPDHIGPHQKPMPKEYHRGRTINRRTPRKSQAKPSAYRQIDRVDARMAKDGGLIWIPVVGAGDAVHGWIELSTVRFVDRDNLTPEGIGGKVTSAAELRITENFSDALDGMKK